MRGLAKIVRLMRDVYNLMRRMQIYLEEMKDCPQLKDDLNDVLSEIKQFISTE